MPAPEKGHLAEICKFCCETNVRLIYEFVLPTNYLFAYFVHVVEIPYYEMASFDTVSQFYLKKTSQ